MKVLTIALRLMLVKNDRSENREKHRLCYRTVLENAHRRSPSAVRADEVIE
jgi:hypothetical protein